MHCSACGVCCAGQPRGIHSEGLPTSQPPHACLQRVHLHTSTIPGGAAGSGCGALVLNVDMRVPPCMPADRSGLCSTDAQAALRHACCNS
jgi:hypothetical protein